MPRWAISSSLLALAITTVGWGQERLTQAEALRVAFGAGASVERRTAYLDPAGLAEARRLAGPEVEIRQSVVTYYVGRQRGRPVGAAWFDAHVVRSKEEVAMVVVDTAGRVRLVEVLRFDEPPEYRAPERWLEQLEGRALDDRLSHKGAIVNLTGATLTARALVRATRRMLALHQVIRPFEASP